jgi:hypothetical protein
VEKLKIYVASSWRCERQQDVVRRLREEGFEVYDFKNPSSDDRGFGWSQIDPNWQKWTAAEYVAALKHPAAVRGLANDFGAMRWCDALVMVQPCGRSANLELGWAIGNGKRTIALLAEGQEPELMTHLANDLCLTLDEVVAKLKETKRRPRRVWVESPFAAPSAKLPCPHFIQPTWDTLGDKGGNPVLVPRPVSRKKCPICTAQINAERQLNEAYLNAALYDCYLRGEAPFASHAIGPRVLDDDNERERVIGMEAGFAWSEVCELVAVYTDLGISSGMQKGIERWGARGLTVERRSLSGWAR